jgi:integrase/recombinase XerD
MSKIKSIKETIGTKEFKRLNAFVQADDKMRDATKQNMLRTFTMLYYTGARISELLQIKNEDIVSIIENQELIIISHKVKRERKIQFSETAVKAISKLFAHSLENEAKDTFIIKSRGSVVLNKVPKISVYTNSVNKVIQDALGDRYSSHCFRRGILTEMASNMVNPRIMQSYIGHASLSSTMLYIHPSDLDIRTALVR